MEIITYYVYDTGGPKRGCAVVVGRIASRPERNRSKQRRALDKRSSETGPRQWKQSHPDYDLSEVIERIRSSEFCPEPVHTRCSPIPAFPHTRAISRGMVTHSRRSGRRTGIVFA